MSALLTRIQFDVKPRMLGVLDGLRNRLEMSSRSEVIRTAIRFYAWYSDMRAKGWELALVRGDKTRIITLPLP